ncbi:MAG: hypothetical protein H6P98_2529 [Candidatus Aminicenantes bacterium]|nr:hypothetical protein [Candidatus Aminicenantes bacterium]
MRQGLRVDLAFRRAETQPMGSLKSAAVLVVIAVVGSCASCGRADFGGAEKTYAQSGKLLKMNPKSAPFPHPERKNGYVHDGEFFRFKNHYDDDTVALFVPRRYRSEEDVDLVFYFHGWRQNLAGVLSSYEIIEQFVRSRRNAILVIPQGPKDAPDSFGGKLEDGDGFRRLVGDILARLRRLGISRAEKPGAIVLAGHSGGYHVLAQILARGGLTGNIREVYLFDALYGEADEFAYWLEDQKGKIIDIYTQDGGTKAESEDWLAALTGRGIRCLAARDSEVTDHDLMTNRVIFLASALGHDEVVYRDNAFSRFLEASQLGLTD